MKTIKLCVGLLLLVFTSACSESIEANNEDNLEVLFVSNEQLEENKLSVGQPVKHDFQTVITLNGYAKVEPSSSYDINTFIIGFVKELFINPGDYVEKGSVVAILEHPEILKLQENYAVAYSRVSYLENEYNRMSNLQSNDVISIKEFSKVKAEFEYARAEFTSLKHLIGIVGLSSEDVLSGKMQAILPIRSKASGWISTVNVRSGELVNAEHPIATLIDAKGLQLELAVFEKDIENIEVGQEITFQSHGSKTSYIATISRKGVLINDNRSVTIYATLPDTLKKGQLSVGGFVRAELITNRKSLFALPPTAFSERNGGFKVLKVIQKTRDGYELKESFVEGLVGSDGWGAFESYDTNYPQEYLLTGAFDLMVK